MAGPSPVPSAVPSGAVWNPDDRVWEVAERDAEGRRHGECRTYRADGTLFQVRRFQDDIAEGPFVVYHPNGQVARAGAYLAGAISGPYVATASDAPTTEPLRDCCVPATAWSLRARYARGKPVFEFFADREGRALLSNGSLRPEPPADLPATVELDETDRRWVSGAVDGDGNPTGWYCSWTLEGRLAGEQEYRDGALRFERIYGADGGVIQERAFTGDRVPHGAHRRRFATADEHGYADRRIREEQGRFEHGHPIGRWTFHDDGGETLATLDLGSGLDPADLETSPVFGRRGPAVGDSTVWWRLSAALRAEGRLREAIGAAARAAGGAHAETDADTDTDTDTDTDASRSRDAAALRAFLSETVMTLMPDARAQRGRQLDDSAIETRDSVLDALLTGADPAAAFRALGAVIESANPAALDFVNASLLLAPDRPMTYLTRALIRIEQGDDRGAREDAARVEAASPELAASLREQINPRFPRFTFWPAQEPLDPADGGDPAGETPPQAPAQTPAAIRHVIQVYATRLARLRAAVGARLVVTREPAAPDPTWLPPDTSALLPDGPIALRRETLTVSVEGEAGPETAEIHVDEELPPERLAVLSVSELLAAARANWSALTWLCWACGLDRVALPDHVVPPPTFTAAVAMSVARCFRAHDKLLTGGVRGLAQGLPSFDWEGMPIHRLPAHFAAIVAAEYLELRSMFLWLVLPDASSPFQDDLREA